MSVTPDRSTSDRHELSSPGRKRKVAIACQGGGSHTAFTAGVLDRLMGSTELAHTEIVGISGTSGGAICALVAWSALVDGRQQDAGDRLIGFWADNAADGPQDGLLNAWMVGAGTLQNLGLLPGVSPYRIPEALGGLDQFRDLLRRHVDFDAISVDHDGRHPVLVLGAVDVLSGRFRAFHSRHDRITTESVLASAALPNLFRAIHTDGGVYWDGLFSQNPPVAELLDTGPDELWVIQINPREQEREPQSLLDIADRRNELAGNLSLYQELGFIEKIDRMLEDGVLTPDSGYRTVTVRVIELSRSALSGTLGGTSKLNRDPRLLNGLIEHGRERADRFLTALRFERAWADRDADAVLAVFADDAELVCTAPFPTRAGDLRRFVTEHLYDDIRIDSSRKQIAGDRVTWTIRMRAGDTAAAVEGAAELTVRGGRVSSLRLGPAR